MICYSCCQETPPWSTCRERYTRAWLADGTQGAEIKVNLSIFGTGYVGLVTAVCFAEIGHSVVAVDKDPEVVARLADGVPTLYEPGLPELLVSNLPPGG